MKLLKNDRQSGILRTAETKTHSPRLAFYASADYPPERARAPGKLSDPALPWAQHEALHATSFGDLDVPAPYHQGGARSSESAQV